MKNILSVVMVSFIVVMSMMSANVDGLAHNHDIAGDIVSAKCECGFETTMKLGAGKSNYKTTCNFPYHCKDCYSLSVLNTLSDKQSCKKCFSEEVISYDNDSLRAGKSSNPVFGWNINDKSFKLTDDFYICPQCREFKLKFTSIGNFD